MRKRIENLLARIEDPELREELRRELERGGESGEDLKGGLVVMETIQLIAPPVTLHKGDFLSWNGIHFHQKESNLYIPRHALFRFIQMGKVRKLEDHG